MEIHQVTEYMSADTVACAHKKRNIFGEINPKHELASKKVTFSSTGGSSMTQGVHCHLKVYLLFCPVAPSLKSCGTAVIEQMERDSKFISSLSVLEDRVPRPG